MIKFTKILFLTTNLSSVVGSSCAFKENVVNKSIPIVEKDKENNNDNDKLKISRKPMFNIPVLCTRAKDLKYNYNEEYKSATYQSDFDNFYSLTDLYLDNLKDYWILSKLDLNIKMAGLRNTKCLLNDKLRENSNFELERFTSYGITNQLYDDFYDLKLNLNVREKYKSFEKNIVTYKETLGVYIKHKLYISIEKVDNNEKKGLRVYGNIFEEIQKNKGIRNFSNEKYYGHFIWGGLILSNLNVDINWYPSWIEKNEFNPDSNFYVIHKDNALLPWYQIATKLEMTQELLKKFNNNSYLKLILCNCVQTSLYEPGYAIYKLVDTSNNNEIILKNYVIKFINKNIKKTHKVSIVYCAYGPLDLNDMFNKVNKYMFYEYGLQKDELEMDINHDDNPEQYHRALREGRASFIFFIKCRDGSYNKMEVTYYKHDSETNEKIVPWKNVKFISGLQKKGESENFEHKLTGFLKSDEYEKLIYLIPYVKIENKKSKIIWLTNKYELDASNINYSDNVKVIIRNDNSLLIQAIKCGKGSININIPDKNYSKTIFVNIVSEYNYFELETNRINIKQGTWGKIKYKKNNSEKLFFKVNPEEVEVLHTDDEISIKTFTNKPIEIIVICETSRKKEIVKVNYSNDIEKLRLNKTNIFIEPNKEAKINIMNFDFINFKKIKLIFDKEKLNAYLKKDNIYLKPLTNEPTNLEINYYDQVETINVKPLKKVTEKNISINAISHVFEKNKYEIIFVDNNVKVMDYIDSYFLKLIDENKSSKIVFINDEGELIYLTLGKENKENNLEENSEKKDPKKKDSEKKESKKNSENNSNNKQKNNKNLMIIIIFMSVVIITLISVLTFLFTKNKLKKNKAKNQ